MTIATDRAELAAPLQGVLDGIGRKVRTARREQNMTLQTLAARAGISPSMLSTVERGNISPSVGTLYAVASALEISLETLFATGDERAVIRASEQRNLTTDGGARRRVAIDIPAAQFELYIDEYPPGAAHAAAASSHRGHEYGVCLEGELVVELDGEEHRVASGDAVQFDARTRHLIRNRSHAVATAAWVNVRRTR